MKITLRDVWAFNAGMYLTLFVFIGADLLL